jgi:hypothetical protein
MSVTSNVKSFPEIKIGSRYIRMCSNFYLFNYCEIWESQIEEEMPLLLSLSLFLELPKEKLYIQSVSIALID